MRTILHTTISPVSPQGGPTTYEAKVRSLGLIGTGNNRLQALLDLKAAVETAVTNAGLDPADFSLDVG